MPFHSVFRFNVGDSLAEIKVTGQRCLGVYDNIAIVGQKYHHGVTQMRLRHAVLSPTR